MEGVIVNMFSIEFFLLMFGIVGFLMLMELLGLPIIHILSEDF